MKPWRLVDEHRVLGGTRPVVRRRYRQPDGNETEVDVTVEGESAVVLAMTDEDEVVLVRQFRPGPGRVMFDLPAGFLEPGEAAIHAATRELREETGYQAGSITGVGTAIPAAYADEKRNVFVATGCTPGRGKDTDADERVETVVVSLPELRRLLRTGELVTTDAAYIALDATGRL